MDGAMHETVLISLAAVVALIVIVILLGMRYLRADDEDDFDDDVSAEHGRSRSHGSRHPHQSARPRRQHDDLPDERLRQRPGAVPVGAGRAVRGASARSGAGRGPADLPVDDRGWPEESSARRGRAELPHRDSRSARSAGRRDHDGSRRDHDDISEPAAASARRGLTDPGRGADRGIDDFEARTARMPVPPREYERDLADGRDGRDRRDGRDGRDGRELRDRRDGREVDGRDGREFDGREFRDRQDARPVAGAREMAGADRDEPDRRTATRPGPRQDGRKNGAVGDRDELPAIKPRQGRGKRDEDGDWPSNEWDELSDVDYWAELASDKPLTTTPPDEQAGRSIRRASRSANGQAPARGDRDAGKAGRQGRQPDPARQADQGLIPAAARQADPVPGSWSEDLGGSRRSGLGRTEQLHAVPAGPAPGREPRHIPPADDDPLTSPSFPRVAADDSRSYRRARRPGSDESQPIPRVSDGASRELPQADGQGQAREMSQTREMSQRAQSRVEPIRGLDGSSRPHGYSQSAGPAGDYERANPDYATSAADPYSPAPSYQLPAVASVGGYQDNTAAYSTPPSSADLLSAGPLSAATDGYPIPGGSVPGGFQSPGGYPGLSGTGQNGYPGNGDSSPASYLPPAAGLAGSGGYGGETVVRGSYQPTSQEPGGYPAQAADPGGYQASLPASGGYPDTGPGGNSATSATGGYAFGSDAADYRSGADLAGDYPGYADSGRSSGAHSRPDPGYLPDEYAAGHDPGPHGSPPAARHDAGYSLYPAPVPVGHGSPHPAPAGQQLPGPAVGYQEQPYQPGPYDPAGYPAPAPQPGYAGADPYAVDPYGRTGYGSGG